MTGLPPEVEVCHSGTRQVGPCGHGGLGCRCGGLFALDATWANVVPRHRQ